MNIRTLAIILIAILGLSGCRYTSEVNLHSGQQTYKASQFFKSGTHYFQSSDKKYFMRLVVDGTTAKATEQSTSANSPLVAEFVAFANAGKSSGNFYVAVTKSKEAYGYHPFKFNKTSQWIKWVNPPSTTKVKSWREMVSLASKEFADGDYRYYQRSSKAAFDRATSDANRRALIAKQKKKQEETSKTGPSASLPPSGIDRLDLGDVVFVQGFFSDEGVQVVRIDRGSGQVKVRRIEDGTTKWVHHSQLINRDQKDFNNGVRIGGTIALTVCILSPETCKKK